MQLRPARPDDVPRLQAIEVAAGTLFAGTPHTFVVDHPPPAADELLAAAAVIVAVDDADEPVGYARIELVGGQPHLEQLSVDPAHGRTGIGTALLDAVQAWAGDRPVTLTTFTDVPFNRPYYERRGFAVVPGDEWTPALRALVAEEATHGLDPAVRVVMRRVSTASDASVASDG